jgi:hypothetical protein
MSVIDQIPGHEPSCPCSVCVAERKIMVRSSHPLMGKMPQPTRTLVPVEQAIAQLMEARDCYAGKIAEIDLQLKDLRDI